MESTHPKLGDRSLFPDLVARAYLHHGGISPASTAVCRAAAEVTADYAKRGADAFFDWHTRRLALKERLGALIGVDASDLSLAPNTTSGVIDIAMSLPWERGDRVIVFEGEFPSNVTPWQRAAAIFGLEVVMLPLSDYAEENEPGLARLRAELSKGARLVAVSAVEFQTGLRMPLGEMATLAHEHGAELFVDGVQACGAVPIDAKALGVDYLACGSHKWLMGLEGAGFLYVAPNRVAKLRPALAGWLSHEDALGFLFEGSGHLRYDRPIRKRADLFEVGNCSAIGFAALAASVDLILTLGVFAIYEHVNRYNDALEEGLVARGFASLRAKQPSRRSCTLGVVPADSSGLRATEVARELSKRGVVCGVPDGVIRFTPHFPNPLSEAAMVLDAVDESIAALR